MSEEGEEDQQMRLLLEEFPIYELRQIIKEREITFKSNKKYEIVNRLLEEVDWSDEERQRLVGRLARVNQEGRPLSNYILVIDNYPDVKETAREIVSNNPAEFDEDDVPIQSGYEIVSEDSDKIDITRWKVSYERDFERISGKVTESIERSAMGITININDMRVYITTQNYQRAKSIRSLLVNHAFEFDNVGHKRISAQEVKDLVTEFVDSIEEELKEVNENNGQ